MSVDPLQADIIRRISEKGTMHDGNQPPCRAWTYFSMSENLEGEYECTNDGDVGVQAPVGNIVDDVNKDPSITDIVLYDQCNHVSELIWKGEVIFVIFCTI